MIKRIELVNFMSHERTVIEPSSALTVLIGPNNCGKSAFVSALQILCHNARSSYVMRHGEKKCQIIVETNDGHIVEWSKTKSGSPHYLIDGEKHDRLRGGVPEQVHQILKLDKVNCDKDQFDIHFGEQKSPVFLLNDPGRAAAQFFASSSDAIRLVEMQDRHKGKVRDAKKDAKRLTTEKEQLTEALDVLEPITEIEDRLKQCESEHQQLEQIEQTIAQTEILIRAIEELELKLVDQQASLEVLSNLAEPPTIEDSDRLEKIQTGIVSASVLLGRATASNESLKQLSQPPELEDEKEIAFLANNIVSANRLFDISNRQAAKLSSVRPVPTLDDESELQTLLRKICKTQTKSKQIVERAKLLGAIKEPPQLPKHDEFELLVSQYVKSKTTLTKFASKLKLIETESSLAKTEIKEWVDSNPSCPTCGAETDVEQLLAGARGGHRHGEA